MTTSSDDTNFIVGEWVEVKVTPTEVEFYSKFRLKKERHFSFLFKIIFSLAIKACQIMNDNQSKTLHLIQDFCETDESDPIVRKNPNGKFSDIFYFDDVYS